MDYIMRTAARIFEQNDPIVIGTAIAIGVLLLFLVVGRLVRKQQATGEAIADPLAKETADTTAGAATDAQPDIELSMRDDPTPGDPRGADAVMASEVDETPPDRSHAAAAHRSNEDDEVGDIDDFTIPDIEAAQPPKKSRFFGPSWMNPDSEAQADEGEEPDERAMHAAAECARLAEIERNILALRELYEAGLIAPEVYVLKAREFAAQSR